MSSYFVTGIGTGIGKTLVSAILVRKLKASYWKPIQAGNLERTDSDIVCELASYNYTPKIIREAYLLKNPMSPHAAAQLDNVRIDLNTITLPHSDSPLIIEGAGGALVPLNDHHLVINLIEKFAIPVIIVSRFYLGSINHTLLTVEAFKSRNLAIAGIIFNGVPNPDSEEAILKFSKVKKLGHIPDMPIVTSKVITELGSNLLLTP